MSEIFADSFYWIALANPADAWHQSATKFSQTTPEARLVTTDEVLSEFLNYFSAAGERKRGVVSRMFEPSLTDCISMTTMRERNITEVLTHDHHFAQEGFTLRL